MTEEVDTSICPFCKQANRCSVETASACWCHQVKIPSELMKLVPDNIKNKSCICNGCVTRFKNDPDLFLKNRGV